MIAGVRAALERVALAPGRLVVAGHSAGAALAADYAAVATARGLPAPAAVFSVYPGRKLRHLPVPIPTVDLSSIAPATRVVIFAGERDTAVGSTTAREIAVGAAQADVTLTTIVDDAVDDHSAPRRASGAAQRTFWTPLDRLIDETATTSGGERAVGVSSAARLVGRPAGAPFRGSQRHPRAGPSSREGARLARGARARGAGRSRSGGRRLHRRRAAPGRASSQRPDWPA